MWFGCGSHVLLDEPEKLLSRTNQCCDQEEINTLREERDTAREALRDCVWWAESVSRRVTEDRESINWTGLQLARKALADIEKEGK